MRNSFAFTYILLTVAQMILSNYFHFTPYMMMTILPVMVLCIPTKTGTIQAMLIALESMRCRWFRSHSCGARS